MQNIRYPILGRQTILPMYVSGIGISEREYHINRESGLVSHQFLFTKSGSGVLHIDGKTYCLDKDSFFYVSPSVPHEYYPENGQWTTCWVVFRGNHLNELMKELGFPSYCVCSVSDISEFEKLFGMLLAADDPVSEGEKCSMLIYEYVLAVHRLLNGEAPASVGNGIVASAVAYIDENYMKDITLDELCFAARVSAQHFCRLFKKQMAMRPLEYIARRRVSQAKLMLRSSDESVADIGRSVGYLDPTYFGAVFKKYEGISPSEYRKRRDHLAI